MTILILRVQINELVLILLYETFFDFLMLNPIKNFR